MKTTNHILSLLFILVTLFCLKKTQAQEIHDLLSTLAPFDASSVIKAQKKFNNRYSTETVIDSRNAIIPVNLIRDTWFNAVPQDSANGLVFHYLIGEDNRTLYYLIGLGYAANSELLKHKPFPPNSDIQFAHYYLLESRERKSAEIVAADPKVANSISYEILDSLHGDYDRRLNRRNWFYIINRDVKNIRKHPNMIYYPFEDLKEFYDEYNNNFSYYISEYDIRNIDDPELYLFISTGAYNAENEGLIKLHRNFHSTILRFGTTNGLVHKAFRLDDEEYSREYQRKAFDVGVLCPPNCPSEIWPSN